MNPFLQQQASHVRLASVGPVEIGMPRSHVVDGMPHDDASDDPFFEELSDADEQRAVPEFKAHHKDTFGSQRVPGGDHVVTMLYGLCHRLFNQHMLAMLQRQDGILVVRVVR